MVCLSRNRKDIAILVVEDSLDQIDIMKCLLGRRGYENVLTAYNGIEGAKVLEGKPVDILILDSSEAGEIDETVKKFQEKGLGVIAYSGSKDFLGTKTPYADAHFLKPVGIERLDNAIIDLACR